jgi:hypothetical protein
MYKCLLLCLALFSQGEMVNAQATVWAQGYVTYTQNYCGGAAPSPELIASLATPKPLVNKVLYVKLGAKNTSKSVVVKKIILDDSGRFAIKLRVGQTYCFLEEWKGKPFVAPQNTSTVIWDIQCLRQRYAQADYVLKVTQKEKILVRINFPMPCFYAPYCGAYMGPMPP